MTILPNKNNMAHLFSITSLMVLATDEIGITSDSFDVRETNDFYQVWRGSYCCFSICKYDGTFHFREASGQDGIHIIFKVNDVDFTCTVYSDRVEALQHDPAAGLEFV